MEKKSDLYCQALGFEENVDKNFLENNAEGQDAKKILFCGKLEVTEKIATEDNRSTALHLYDQFTNSEENNLKKRKKLLQRKCHERNVKITKSFLQKIK